MSAFFMGERRRKANVMVDKKVCFQLIEIEMEVSISLKNIPNEF